MLDAQDLHITFNPGTPIENPVLRGMTLSIPEGEFVSVIGSNGAGKSTFLNAIAGDLRVDSGTIRINHEDVTRLPTWDRSERVARVFQDPMAGTCEALTIEENMALALARGNRAGCVVPSIARPVSCSASDCPCCAWDWRTAWATASVCCRAVSARPSVC